MWCECACRLLEDWTVCLSCFFLGPHYEFLRSSYSPVLLVDETPSPVHWSHPYTSSTNNWGKKKEKEETIGIQIFLETCSVHEHAILGKSQLSGSAFCSLCKPAGDLASSTSNQSNKFHRGIPYYCSSRPCMDFCFFYLLESFLIGSLFPKFFTSCCNAASSNPICNILDHWFLLTCSYYVVISLQRH